jgi:hypothetical protein
MSEEDPYFRRSGGPTPDAHTGPVPMTALCKIDHINRNSCRRDTASINLVRPPRVARSNFTADIRRAYISHAALAIGWRRRSQLAQGRTARSVQKSAARSNFPKQKQDQQNNNHNAEAAAPVVPGTVKRAAPDSAKSAQQCYHQDDENDGPN